MTLDARPQIDREGIALTPTIDFNKPPTTIEDYKFGGSITRDNFAHFMIDNFARSRGKFTPQAYSWVWLDRHVGTRVSEMMKDFLARGGFEKLTEDEQRDIIDNFKNVKKHPGLEAMNQENDSFTKEFNEQVESVIRIVEKAGSAELIRVGVKPVKVNPMEESILGKEKEDFIHWMATYSDNTNFLQAVKTPRF